MKKRSTFLASLGMVLVLSLFLVACGDNGTGGNRGGEIDHDDPITALVPPHIAELINRAMPTAEQSEHDVIDGGTLRFALVAGTPFSGVLHPIWSMSADDSHLQTFFLGSMISVDDNFLLDPESTGDLVRTFEISEDGKMITFFLRDGLYWHDGPQVTTRDWLLAYEVLANPDSGTTRFGQQNSDRIVGIQDFRAGDADYIAGIRIIDDLTIEFEFDGVVPIRNTVFTFPLPYHIFADMPIEDMQDSRYVNTDAAIGFGPFKIDVIVPGESMTFTRNENYVFGAPILDGVEVRRISPDLIGPELEAGTVDVATAFQEASYNYFGHIDNVTFLKAPGWAWNTITFRVGYFDDAAGTAAIDPDAPMSDINLRLAMWKAIDMDLVSDSFFDGLRWSGSSPIPPIHQNFHNPNIERPPYSMDDAHALLDEAGYEWDAAEEWRTFPGTNDRLELTFTFAASAGNASAEGVLQYHIAQWRELGIYLNLREYEFASWGQLFTTEHDDIDWDVQINAWSSGTNPSPAGFFRPNQGFNRSRYTSARMTELLDRIDSEEAILDPEGYRIDAVWEFQEYVREQAIVIPTQYRFAFIPINNRVVDFEIVASPSPSRGWHLVGLTHEEPLRHGQ